jgi:mannose-6-phosphate isomerase-like protein (cupin superfamily)
MAGLKTQVTNDRYTIKTVSFGGLTCSETKLNPGKSTRGHSHPWDEVYFFVSGNGSLTLNHLKAATVESGTFVEIEPGEHHRVFNASDEPLVFICCFKACKGKSAIHVANGSVIALISSG